MNTISYYDKKEEKYLYLDLSSAGTVKEPTVTAIPDIDGLPAQKWYSTPDGRYTYLSAFRYTLRDDMARKIRRRFFRQDNATGELQEMFQKWDRSMFQVNNPFFLRDGLLFMIACYTETGINAAFMVDINEDFDGASPKLLWETNAYPYGFNMSPDGQRLAYHLAGYDPQYNPRGAYAINLMDMTGERTLVCSEDGHLFFDPTWSPDGQWLVFQDCIPASDPGHHFSDLVICRPDGSGFRYLTSGGRCYFNTSFGLPGYRMGGSNYPIWTPDNRLICSPMLDGSHPDCHFDGSQRNHEELIYDPSQGRGGCGLSLLDPTTGEMTPLTPAQESCWDFRPRLHAEENLLLYTHSAFGEASEIRLMDLNTGEIRVLTNGTGGFGADHAAFVS